MQSLYELLKSSKGLPVSDSYTALWGKSAAESGIKTLTGKLPLFFRTSDKKLRDWTIHGNNDVGKNLLEITAESQTINGVTFTINRQAGTITTSGSTTSSAAVSYTIYLQPGSYIFTCDADANRNVTFDSYVRVPSATLARDNDSDEPGNAFTIDEERTVYIYNRIWARNGDTPHVFKPMLRKAGTSADFEPYQIGIGERTESGYVLNIGVGFAPISAYPAVALITSKTINLGESPLTEGQTLSMSDFGDIRTFPDTDIYIAAFEGFNYDDQLSYNQPEMKIKYKE